MTAQIQSKTQRASEAAEALTFAQVETLLRQLPILHAQKTCALDPARRTEAADMVERMTQAIAFLPEPCGRVLQALYLEQCTWIQAETRLFMARNTLACYRRKGIELLRQMLNGPQDHPHKPDAEHVK